eukprot:g681.t1
MEKMQQTSSPSSKLSQEQLSQLLTEFDSFVSNIRTATPLDIDRSLMDAELDISAHSLCFNTTPNQASFSPWTTSTPAAGGVKSLPDATAYASPAGTNGLWGSSQKRLPSSTVSKKFPTLSAFRQQQQEQTTSTPSNVKNTIDFRRLSLADIAESDNNASDTAKILPDMPDMAERGNKATDTAKINPSLSPAGGNDENINSHNQDMSKTSPVRKTEAAVAVLKKEASVAILHNGVPLQETQTRLVQGVQLIVYSPTCVSLHSGHSPTPIQVSGGPLEPAKLSQCAEHLFTH